MKDIRLLELLDIYYTAQKTVVAYMLCAMESFEDGEMEWMWVALFDWCEAKYRREELWKQFKHHYPRAMMLKEGHEV